MCSVRTKGTQAVDSTRYQAPYSAHAVAAAGAAVSSTLAGASAGAASTVAAGAAGVSRLQSVPI